MDFLYSLILFVIGAAAAFINVNAGGGSSLTLPALIFLGLDSATANGTNRIAVLLQNLSAVSAFHKSQNDPAVAWVSDSRRVRPAPTAERGRPAPTAERGEQSPATDKKEKYRQFNLSVKLSLLTLPGAVLGALIAVKIGDELFQKILGVIMIGITITIFLPQSRNNISLDDESKKLSLLTVISFLLIGFYGGFIQVGIGFLLMAVLQRAMKFSLILVNMHKVFIVLMLTIPALIIFIINGNVNWFWGISLALGNALGGWWAAKISIKKGDRFIKLILVIAVLIMATKLTGVIP